ncbi:MAG TPA: acyl-CoA dehydrogenase family protein [Streptosporangiaceae bacterium]|jgi:acyl-CoA dehydrogenase
MSDLLSETVNDLLAGSPGVDTGWDPGLWARLADLGLTGIGVPEERGGAGGTLADAAVVARACGYHAAPVPYADHAFVAVRALTAAGIPLPDGPLTAAFAPPGWTVAADGTASGVLRGVPWGRHAAGVAVIAAEEDAGAIRVALLDPALVRVSAGVNTGGEPRDDLAVEGAPVAEAVRGVAVRGVAVRDMRARAALARAVAITGAARRVLDLTVRYAGEREQFGRPIGRFQAVQQELAELAGAVEQAEAMADLAVALADESADAAWAAAAAAKVGAGRAAGIAVATGHQVHGAIGFTQEHALHTFTRRLLAWRDEYGAEGVWSAELGDLVAAGGSEGLWRLLTSGGVHA